MASFLHRYRPTVASGLFALFALLTLNNVVFRHAHRLANGQIITHAHPYWPTKSKSPYQPNHHTNGQLVLLDALNHAIFLAEPPAQVFAPRIELLFETAVVIFDDNQPFSPLLRAFSQRGPPVVA
ncbi:MAG: hypothetical protein H7Y12_03595 [Sphingobacteriaceae bacterium]|nr:hypothetical protein [Cytophagaceae bacterium]